ncbi:MAG: LapA family protein [Candidatus Lokiarchaeota archaeon]|nr:LapA family protein [Candidatus Lokiarchaeota archaeon]
MNKMIQSKTLKLRKTLIFILLISIFFIISFTINSTQGLSQNSINSNIKISETKEYKKQWLDNSNFTLPYDTWYSEIDGDNSDIYPISVAGEAGYKVIGEEYTFSEISGIPSISDWAQVHNPEFPLFPDTATINAAGCFVSHEFAELADQTPSVHWERNVSLPLDMSDYIITSASLQAVVNGTVTASPGDWAGRGVETPGDTTGGGNTQNFTFDYVRFYVLFSDLTKQKVYEVAYNQTKDLGKDSAGLIDTMADTFMNVVPEEDLIFYLSSVLATDNHNFTITLGMRIWCEDNFISDRDYWNALVIKSCELSFTYQKKINQFTDLSWNQIGDTIVGDNVQVTGGNLKFKYKIDQQWPGVLSPNSELQIKINDNPLLETIKLTEASLNFQEAKPSGFDVRSNILKDVNITLSIHLFLGDTFPLSENYTISITDVYLEITYIEIIPPSEFEPWIFAGLFIIVAMGAAALTGFLIGYIKVWRFPIPIRKIRKYSKTLEEEIGPKVPIIRRKSAFHKSYDSELQKTSQFLKGEPLDGKMAREKLLGKESVNAKNTVDLKE